MNTSMTQGSFNTAWRPAVKQPAAEIRWSLAFVGLLLYALVEYASLPAMYPALSPLRLGKVAVGLAALGYLLHPRVSSKRHSTMQAFDVAIVLFTLITFLSACFAPRTTYVWDNFSDVLIWVVIYFLVSRILVSSWRLRFFLFFVLLLNLKLAQFTVRQYITARGTGASEMQIIMTGGPAVGSSAFFGNAADLGLAMAVVWGITFALLFGKTEKRKLSRVFLIICFVSFLLAVLLCGSRGAVVGAAAIVLVALARTPQKLGAVVFALFFLLSLSFVLPDASKERFRSAWDWQNDPNAASRIHFWRVGLQMFSDYPALGVGPGNYPQMYANEYGGGKPFVVHSVYIQALSELGLLGTACFLVLIFLFLRLNARTRKFALASGLGKQTFQYCLPLALDLAMVGYLASGAFVAVLYYPHVWILFGLSVAANAACVSQAESIPGIEGVGARKMALVTS